MVYLNYTKIDEEAETQSYEGKSTRSIPKVVRVKQSTFKAQSNEPTFGDDLAVCFIEVLNDIRVAVDHFRVTPLYQQSLQLMMQYLRAYRMCQTALRAIQSSITLHASQTTDQLFYSQADEEIQDQTVYQQKLTTFYEDSEVHAPPRDYTDPSFAIYPHPSMEVDLMNFIKRPYPVATFSWASSNTMGSEIKIKNGNPLMFPDCFGSLLFCKVSNVQYWRPTFEVEIRVNGTNFHYGRLLFAVYPSPATIDPVYLNYYNASTWKWYQINPSSHQTVKFTLPYVSHMRRMSLTLNGESDKMVRQLWSMRCFVTAPLQSAQQAAVPPVEVVVWARVVDPGFSSFTYDPPDFAAQGEERDAKNGTIVTDNGNHPPLMTVDLNSVSEIVSKLSALYKSGFSVPPTLEALKSIQVKNTMCSRADDTPNTRVLGPSQSARLDHNYTHVNGSPDEMNLVKFSSHPSLVYVGKIETTSKPGDILYQHELTPSTMSYTDYVFTPEADTYWPIPLCYVARLFKYWRGSFKVHISFIASSFHSCKVRFCWVPKPGAGVSYPRSLTLEQTSNILNEVLDINKQTEYSFVVPWDSNYDYLDVDLPATGQFSNGCMYLQMINTLTSSFNTPQPIYFQVFVSAAEDFQFAVPRTQYTEIYGTPDYDSISFVAQGEVMECELPSSSYKCLMNTNYLPLGGQANAYRLGRINMAYEVTSFKQLANMLSRFDRVHMITSEAHSYSFIPFGEYKRKFDDGMWDCYLPHIIAVFKYWAGSLRIAAIPINGGCLGSHVSNMVAEGQRINSSFWNNAGYENVSTEGVYISAPHGYQTNTADPLDVTVPYFASVSCIPTNSGRHLPGVYSTEVHIEIQNSPIEKDVIMCLAGGDDLLFGYQTGIPRCRTRPAPPPPGGQ